MNELRAIRTLASLALVMAAILREPEEKEREVGRREGEGGKLIRQQGQNPVTENNQLGG